MREQRQQLQQALGYQFRQSDLLLLALRHGSKAKETDGLQASNERLEFLGDSVVGLVVCDFLYRYYPDCNEGRLAQMKSTLVSTEHLAEKARTLNLGACVEMGRGEQEGSRERNNLLADTLEAVLGAIFLEAGFAEAQRVVLHLFDEELQAAEELRRDFKSLLQEVTQRDFQCLPEYLMLEEIGPPHDRIFRVEVTLQGKALGQGQGRSKREAGQRAAQLALLHLQGAQREQGEEAERTPQSGD